MEMLLELLVAICTGIFFVLIVALGSERGTQIVKTILRWISEKLSVEAIAPKGIGSWFLALVVAGLAVYGFDVDALSGYEAFSDLDPNLVKALNMMIVWVMSQIQHEKLKTFTAEAKNKQLQAPG